MGGWGEVVLSVSMQNATTSYFKNSTLIHLKVNEYFFSANLALLVLNGTMYMFQSESIFVVLKCLDE